MKPEVVFAMYKPHAGKDVELEKLIAQHVPTLKDLGLITDRPTITLKTKNSTYIEIFEWRDINAAEEAHEHPAVAKIWEKMSTVADFTNMKSLSENEDRFPHFKVIENLSSKL